MHALAGRLYYPRIGGLPAGSGAAPRDRASCGRFPRVSAILAGLGVRPPPLSAVSRSQGAPQGARQVKQGCRHPWERARSCGSAFWAGRVSRSRQTPALQDWKPLVIRTPTEHCLSLSPEVNRVWRWQNPNQICRGGGELVTGLLGVLQPEPGLSHWREALPAWQEGSAPVGPIPAPVNSPWRRARPASAV